VNKHIRNRERQTAMSGNPFHGTLAIIRNGRQRRFHGLVIVFRASACPNWRVATAAALGSSAASLGCSDGRPKTMLGGSRRRRKALNADRDQHENGRYRPQIAMTPEHVTPSGASILLTRSPTVQSGLSGGFSGAVPNKSAGTR
jgi:hypothetical protein